MRPIARRRPGVLGPVLLVLFASTGFGQGESAYVKLLKKAPEGRMSQILDVIGKRGTLDDLAFVYDRATASEGFPTSVRARAFEILEDAAATRGLRPQVDLAPLARRIGSSETPVIRLAAIRLAGAWKAEATVPELREVAGAKLAAPSARAAAFNALASIGSEPARSAIDALGSSDRPASVRALAVAALARFDLDLAAEKAAATLTDDARAEDVTPLIAAFLDRQGGGDKLAAALLVRKPTVDGARLALRSVYALGRADEKLIAVLSHAAGLAAEAKLPSKEEMDALVLEVGAKGDPRRGEAIFRRAELNCIKCHALVGAGGGVGPELSALGLSSPVDYVVNSILIPDQAIKEEYQTRMVLTDDGRIHQGIVVEEDDKRVVLKDATGEKRIVPVSTIEDSKKGGSLMPKGLSNMLTRAEFVDLVRFLSELGKPGPYAIRPTPTIQRWRVLKSSPGTISEALGAPSTDWTPAYAEVAGTLPMADVVAASGSPKAYVQGEIAVSSGGPITLRLGPSTALFGWIDERPLPTGDAPTVEVSEGTHKLTWLVDEAARDGRAIRVEVVKPEGSTVEFSVVGGR